ncbi:MAG: hypothetical protein ACJAS3_001737 [Roseivirga sp.]
MKAIVKSFAFLVICSSLWNCKAPPKEPIEDLNNEQMEASVEEPRTMIAGSMPNYKLEFSSLQLNMPLGELDQRVFKHYGEFYTEDFTIFQLDRIDYLAESHYIDQINLYFIDSALVKIQAFLREDKSNEFITQFGKAKIVVSDYSNRKLLETEKILVKKGGRVKINEKLSQFKLRWSRDNADIEYELNEKLQIDSVIEVPKYSSILNPNNFKYKLTFQAKDFDYQMAWIKWESYKESRGLTTTIGDN